MSSDGRVVEKLQLSYDEYYDGSAPMIDSDSFRKSRGIRSITGEIYDSSGSLQQRFENRYNELGAYSGGRTEFDDGTVVED